MVFLFVASILAQIFFLTNCFTKCTKRKYEYCFFVSCGIALLFDIIIVYILAYMSKYSRLNEIIIMLISVIVLCVVCVMKKAIVKPHISKQLISLLLVGIVVFMFNSLFHVEEATGWRDNSGYYYEAIHIAKSGSLFYNDVDEKSEDADDLEMATTFSYAGLHKIEDCSYSKYFTWVVPFYSCSLALFYDLFGVSGLSYVGAIFSAIICILIFLYIRQFFGLKVAYFVTFSVMLNPAEIWASRITLAEISCQFMLILAFLIYSIDIHNKVCIIASAGIVSLTVVAKMDMLIAIAGVFLAWIICLVFADEIDSITNYTRYVLCLLPIALALLYGTSKKYLIMHWEDGYLDKIIYLVVFLIIFGNVIYVYRKKTSRLPFDVEKIKKIDVNKKFVSQWFVFVLLFISLMIKTGHFTQVNLLWLQSWYVSLPIILLAPIGAFYLLKNNMLLRNSIPFGIGIMFWAIYTYSASATGDHMWISRRWVTVIIPFLIVLGLYFVYQFVANNIVTIAVCLCLIIWSTYQSRGFVISNIMEGCFSMNEDMADGLDDRIYFCSNRYMSTVLFAGFGKNAYVLDGENVEEYIEKHGPISYIGDEAYLERILEETDVNWVLTKRNIKYTYDLERTVDCIPSQHTPFILDYSLYELSIE